MSMNDAQDANYAAADKEGAQMDKAAQSALKAFHSTAESCAQTAAAAQKALPGIQNAVRGLIEQAPRRTQTKGISTEQAATTLADEITDSGPPRPQGP